MKNIWPCPSFRVRNLKRKSLPVAITLLRSKRTCRDLVEACRVRRHTAWAKTSRKCSTSSTKTRRVGALWCGKTRGASPRERLVSCTWCTAMTTASCCRQRSRRCRRSSFQSLIVSFRTRPSRRWTVRFISLAQSRFRQFFSQRLSYLRSARFR